MLAIRNILHATDFSEYSTYAFRLACSLARDHCARLIVVHVIPETRAPRAGIMTPPPSEDYLEARANLERLKPPGAKVRIERRLLAGEPVEEICQLAQETAAGLIVLGTHGRTGLSRLLMGSIAERVVREADCPVLTVRVPLRIVRRRATARTK